MAKARVQELLEVGKTYPIWTVEKGKFGRYLARIYLDEARNQCVNDMLVEENLALIYFGGSKADVKIALNHMYNRLRKKGVEL
jgi:endonuclease YncB( thermonuclease family)